VHRRERNTKQRRNSATGHGGRWRDQSEREPKERQVRCSSMRARDDAAPGEPTQKTNKGFSRSLIKSSANWINLRSGGKLRPETNLACGGIKTSGTTSGRPGDRQTEKSTYLQRSKSTMKRNTDNDEVKAFGPGRKIRRQPTSAYGIPLVTQSLRKVTEQL